MKFSGAMHTEGLPLDLFTSGEVRWLGIQVGVEAEQQPRVLLRMALPETRGRTLA
jgi:hypothetical protein